jgi:hypothetical protein
MKRSWSKYIIGCFFIIAFLCNSIAPDIMILSGQLTNKMVHETLTEQDDMNSERNTEETQGDPRTEYPPSAHASFYIHPTQLFIVFNNIIPRDIAFIEAVVIPVPTPPPDVTIV